MKRRDCRQLVTAAAAGTVLPAGIGQHRLESEPGAPAQAFELAADDGRFVAPTSVEILDGNRLRLHAPKINRPTFVRLAWRAYPTGWLLNAHGLPSAPFSRRIP